MTLGLRVHLAIRCSDLLHSLMLPRSSRKQERSVTVGRRHSRAVQRSSTDVAVFSRPVPALHTPERQTNWAINDANVSNINEQDHILL